MNGGQEIPSELVVPGDNSTEVFEPTEAAFDDISAPIGPLVETMDDDTVGFVGNHGLSAAVGDLGTKAVAVVAFVGDERAHAGRACQDIGRRSKVGILAGGQMNDNWPAEWIAQRVDFGRPPTARSADRLIVLPPFPPEAQR